MKTEYNFGKTLRKLRRDQDITQEELGRRIGISKQCIGTYERNLREPDLYSIVALADYFEISIDKLFGRKKVDE